MKFVSFTGRRTLMVSFEFHTIFVVSDSNKITSHNKILILFLLAKNKNNERRKILN